MWKELKNLNVEEFTRAREHIHQAVQLVSLTSRAVLPESEEDEHATLSWSDGLNAFIGQPLHPVDEGWKAILSLHDFSWKLVTGTEEMVTIPLAGKGYDQVFEEILEFFKQKGLSTKGFTTQLPYEIPQYDFVEKGVFIVPDKQATTALANFYSNANMLLESFKEENENVSSIKIWPHHFDIAVLVTYPSNPEKSIGLGLSPGDESSKTPYFYLNCWPYPEVKTDQLPPLPSGKWNTIGWTGTVLNSEDVIASNNQEQTVRNFITQSFNSLEKLMKT